MFGKLLFVPLASLALAGASNAPETIETQGADQSQIAPKRHVTPQDWASACEDWDDWEKPAPPFMITPDVWYVGTCGITVLLVHTDDGQVLLDTGTNEGARLAYENIVRLGANPNRVGLILYSHEHFDHVGGMSLLQSVTGAPVLAAPRAAQVLRTGVPDPSDPQHGMHGNMRPAPHVIEIDTAKTVTYGGIEFQPIATPGHTPGALSWHWQICHMRQCKDIVYADSLSPVSSEEYRFSDHPEYLAEYRDGLQRLREVECDILLTPHPSASKMLERATAGKFEGGMNCIEYADAVERRLDARLEREASATE